jgi:hypothetical protein
MEGTFLADDIYSEWGHFSMVLDMMVLDKVLDMEVLDMVLDMVLRLSR